MSSPRPDEVGASLVSFRGMRFSLNTASLRRPLREIACAAKLSGFHGLELWATDINETMTSMRLREILRSNELQVSAFQLLRDFEGSPEHSRPRQLAQADQLMSAMTSVGAETLLLCANTLLECSSDRRLIESDLRMLADMAAERGMRIALEPLAWSRWLNSYEEAVACVEKVNHPALGIAVDSFHWFWAGTPIQFARKIPIEKCFCMQLCDIVRRDLPAIQVARHHRLFPGEGIWPVRELVKEFQDLGYAGFFNLEVFNDDLKDLEARDFADRAARSVNRMLENLPG